MSKSNQHSSAIISKPGALSSALVHNAYGKSQVRLTKIVKKPDCHELKELCVDIRLEGEFSGTYLTGDNSMVVATDSMKNTVYILAADHGLESIESFALSLSEHFLVTYKHVASACVKIGEDLWQRIPLDGKQHKHAFYGAGTEKRTTSVQRTRESFILESGIDDLRVAKTTDSEFAGFVKDEYTCLPETRDRIFGTSITACWQYKRKDCNYNSCHDEVRRTILEVFAGHYSLSVQQTLFAMGDAVLKQLPEVKSITITMPNKHRIPFDLSRFGKDNRNEIFINTDEPYGLITGTVTRKD